MCVVSLLLLGGCPLEEKPRPDTAEPDDTDDTDYTDDTDDTDDTGPPDWDPASTLCGRARIVDGCGTVLPDTVGAWTVVGGATACFEDTGGGPDWRDALVAEAAVDAAGWFQAAVAGGDYALVASEGACYGCQPLTLLEGECARVDLRLGWSSSADKPNVYLYPETPAAVRVSVASPERITADDPAYPVGGWRVTAFPDGRLRTPDGSRDYLFYERTIEPDFFQREEGFCVPGRQAVAAMEDHLAALGFLEAEIADFAEAWDADLPRVGWMTVYPQTERLPALRIAPAPDHLLRAWYYVEEGCRPVRAPAVASVPRTGFHAAEWGLVVAPGMEREEPVVLGWRNTDGH